MDILGKNGLSGWVKRLLDLILAGGLGIIAGLPFILKWYLNLFYVWASWDYYFLLVFLYVTGFFCLAIVHELRKIFKTLNRQNPFMLDNVKSLKRISWCSFAIAAAYVVKIVFYNSFLTIVIAMIFIIVGLFTVILAEVFRQAVVYKEENDLTI